MILVGHAASAHMPLFHVVVPSVAVLVLANTLRFIAVSLSQLAFIHERPSWPFQLHRLLAAWLPALLVLCVAIHCILYRARAITLGE